MPSPTAVLEAILLPSNLIALTATLGLFLILFFRSRGVGSNLLGLAAALLLLFGFLPTGRLALGSLEDRFPSSPTPREVTGIVVLGGEVDTHISARRGMVALTDAGERVTAAAALAAEFPEARLLLSGGISDEHPGQTQTESSLRRDLLAAMGVPAVRIEIEEQSRTTCENALESRRVARPQPGDVWLLVTSANHMPRAIACFRAAGFAVTPYPVDYRTLGIANALQPFPLISDGLAMSDLAAHEWIGLLFYRLTGRSDELFPAPAGATP